MPMSDDDDEPETILGTLGSAVSDGLLNGAAPDDPGIPRDPGWLRWLKFLAIILAPALIFGLIGFFSVMNPGHDSAYAIKSYFWDDTTDAMKFRFWTGAALGGLLGLIHVVRCLIRKVDP